MIQSTGQSLASVYAAQAVANPSSVQSTSAPEDPFKEIRGVSVNGAAIDMNQLFTPSEQKTLENMKEFARTNGMSTTEVSSIEGVLIHSKYHNQSAPLTNKGIGNQIRAIQDGYLKNSNVSLADYQKIYDNFHLFQGADIRV